jgi:hypothetical protein
MGREGEGVRGFGAIFQSAWSLTRVFDLLDGINDILVPQHDQIPDNSPPDLSSDSPSAHQEPLQLSR